MSAAKQNFIERISVIINTIEDTSSYGNFLIDKEPSAVRHNNQARLLRNGLTISAFTILEDFIKQRVGEAMQAVPTLNIKFDSLPKSIKLISTFGAMESIRAKSENIKRQSGDDDCITFIKNNCFHLGSTTDNDAYSFSEYSWGWSKSNLGSDDILVILKTFGIKNCWNVINSLSRETGRTLISSQESFTNFAMSRHSAAHSPIANVDFDTLKNHVNTSLVLAFAVDILLSLSLALYKKNDTVHLAGCYNFTNHVFMYRYVLEVGSSWKEFSDKNSIRAYKVYNNYDLAKIAATQNSINTKRLLIIKSGAEKKMIDWHTLTS